MISLSGVLHDITNKKRNNKPDAFIVLLFVNTSLSGSNSSRTLNTLYIQRLIITNQPLLSTIKAVLLFTRHKLWEIPIHYLLIDRSDAASE
jgi:hypothetical protein